MDSACFKAHHSYILHKKFVVIGYPYIFIG